MIALLISYFLAKKIDKGLFWDTFKNHKEVNRIQSNITKNELGVVMLARISPVLPFAIMNIILPIIGVSLKSFLIGGILGMLPRTLLSIWMGTQLNLLQETITSGKENQMYLYIVILLVIISIGGLLNYSMKILKK